MIHQGLGEQAEPSLLLCSPDPLTRCHLYLNVDRLAQLPNGQSGAPDIPLRRQIPDQASPGENELPALPMRVCEVLRQSMTPP